MGTAVGAEEAGVIGRTYSLRICHVLSSLQVGGAEQFCVRLALAQIRRGNEVQVLALRDGALSRRCREAGLPTCVLESSSTLLRGIQSMPWIARVNST